MDIDTLHPVKWSRPGHDRTTDGVPGTYKVDDKGRIEVHIHDTWDGNASFAFAPDPEFPTMLHGEVFREAVTLVDCQVVSSKTTTTSQQDVVLRPRYAIEGGFFLDPDELSLTDVHLRFTDQDAWTEWDAFAVNQERSSVGLDEAMSTFVRPADREVRVNGGTLRLVDDSYVRQDVGAHRWVLQSRSRFEVHVDNPVAIDELMSRYAYPLQVLLLSATGRMPGLMSMRGTNTAWAFKDGGDPQVSRWATVRCFHGGDGNLPSGSIRYLHRLQDLDFTTHLPRIFDAVEAHRYSFEHFAAIHSEKAGGHLSRFVALTQLVDSFDRSLHPDDRGHRSFDGRLKRLEDESGNLIDSVVGNRLWRNQIRRLRNIVVHGDESAPHLVRDPRPLVAGSEILLLLFEIRFLVEIGFASDAAKSLVEKRGTHWRITSTIKENYPHLVSLVKKHPETADD